MKAQDSIRLFYLQQQAAAAEVSEVNAEDIELKSVSSAAERVDRGKMGGVRLPPFR